VDDTKTTLSVPFGVSAFSEKLVTQGFLIKVGTAPRTGHPGIVTQHDIPASHAVWRFLVARTTQERCFLRLQRDALSREGTLGGSYAYFARLSRPGAQSPSLTTQRHEHPKLL